MVITINSEKVRRGSRKSRAALLVMLAYKYIMCQGGTTRADLQGTSKKKQVGQSNSRSLVSENTFEEQKIDAIHHLVTLGFMPDTCDYGSQR